MRYIGCLFLFIWSLGFTQNKSAIVTYAHTIIDTLCSPNMHGRGYVKKGDSIAAAYIANEFSKLGLKKFTKSYYQYVTISVNTFQSELKFNNYNFTSDFSVKASCPSIKGKYKVFYVDSSIINNENAVLTFQQKNLKGCFLLVDTFRLKTKYAKFILEKVIANPPPGTRGIIVYNNPRKNGTYPWDISQTQDILPHFEIPHQNKPLKSVKINVQSSYLENYKTQNVIGYVRGTTIPDSFIVFTAHYDHLGELGIKKNGTTIYFPGANDNASGCAMLLNLAKYYSANPQKYSIAFMAFTGEELGLVGSDYYTKNPYFDLQKIKFLVNMDIMGTGDDGIMVVNGGVYTNEFEILKNINSEKNLLPTIKMRKKAPISDHYNFDKYGVKTFCLYTLGGVDFYHDVNDKPKTLPLTKFEEIYFLLIEFVNKI